MRIYLGRAIFFGFNMERSAEVPSASPYSISLACSGLRYLGQRSVFKVEKHWGFGVLGWKLGVTTHLEEDPPYG